MTNPDQELINKQLRQRQTNLENAMSELVNRVLILEAELGEVRTRIIILEGGTP